MATLEQSTAAIEKLNVATSKAAKGLATVDARFTALEEKIKNMGLDHDQEAALIAAIHEAAVVTEGLGASLEAMGKDPENPVPVPVPEPEPVP